MQKIVPHQIKKLHTLLSKLDLMDQKIDLISSYTNNRTKSSRQMYYREAADLIDALQEQASGQVHEPSARQKMIRKMLYYGYLLKFDKPGPHQQHLHPKKICYANVDAWCRSDKCSVRKPIRIMNNKELNQALSQFEKMYKRTLRQL